MITLYGLKNCDTCKKALSALRERADVTYVDVRADGLTQEQLNRFHVALGDALINTRSTTWRNLPDDQRTRDPIALLVDHPTLMKRPVIDVDGSLTLGWGKDVQAKLLA